MPRDVTEIKKEPRAGKTSPEWVAKRGSHTLILGLRTADFEGGVAAVPTTGGKSKDGEDLEKETHKNGSYKLNQPRREPTHHPYCTP